MFRSSLTVKDVSWFNLSGLIAVICNLRGCNSQCLNWNKKGAITLNQQLFQVNLFIQPKNKYLAQSHSISYNAGGFFSLLYILERLTVLKQNDGVHLRLEGVQW